MLPFSLKDSLEKQTWYLRFRYSPLVLRLWFMLRIRVEQTIRRQGNRYLSQLNHYTSSNKLIFDIGAHEGFITQFFIDMGYHVVAVEPDQRNFAILETRFGNDSRVALVKAAVSNREGVATFYEGAEDKALGTLSSVWSEFQKAADGKTIDKSDAIEVNTVTLDQLIREHGQPCFIKIDVEGHERAVLETLVHDIDVIAFEAILPLFMNDTRAAVEKLSTAFPAILFNYATDRAIKYDHPVSKEVLLQELESLSAQTVEIFCLRINKE